MIRSCGSVEPHEPHDEECPGWPEESAYPTDEQTLARLRSEVDGDERSLAFLRSLGESADRGARCFIENHEHRVADLLDVNRKVAAVSDWVSGSYDEGIDPEAHIWRRVAKVGEEHGELIEALLGAIGENPRKGVTNGMDKVEHELLDVAMAALGALWFITDGCDVIRRMAEHVDTVWHRAGLAREEARDGLDES